MLKKEILIKKASGHLEPFDPRKLLQSLNVSGADERLAKEILSEIEAWLKPEVSTKKIYAKALGLLRQKTVSAAGKYRVKEALMELGDNGHPFEIFVGEIFKKLNYEVEVGKILQGKSITHEMDVIATKEKNQHLIECKYSQFDSRYVSIQVPLYVHSRVQDIIAHRKKEDAFRGFKFTGWVATNNRFSPDSVKYAEDYGLSLLSWNYPKEYSLRYLIEKHNLFPVTILQSLNTKEKEKLITNKIVTCNALFNNLEHLVALDIPEKRKKILLAELNAINNKNTHKNNAK
jgi:hypothetical protein